MVDHRTKWPPYYAMKTLLGGEPDVNRRYIHAGDGHKEVCVFNQEMRPWTKEDDHQLDVCLKALNDDAKIKDNPL